MHVSSPCDIYAHGKETCMYVLKHDKHCIGSLLCGQCQIREIIEQHSTRTIYRTVYTVVLVLHTIVWKVNSLLSYIYLWVSALANILWLETPSQSQVPAAHTLADLSACAFMQTDSRCCVCVISSTSVPAGAVHMCDWGLSYKYCLVSMCRVQAINWQSSAWYGYHQYCKHQSKLMQDIQQLYKAACNSCRMWHAKCMCW